MRLIDKLEFEAGSAASLALAPTSDSRASQLTYGAGLVVILTGFAAFLLPAAPNWSSGALLGAMMMLGGAVEATAGAFRRRHPAATIAPGLITLTAGALFLFEPFGEFIPDVRLVMAWLAVRAIVLGVGAGYATNSLRTWTTIAAMVDSALAATLFLGLSASTLVFALFGPAPDVVAGFAWIIGASFLASGLLLLETGRSADVNAEA